jgi:hypothetical protein
MQSAKSGENEEGHHLRRIYMDRPADIWLARAAIVVIAILQLGVVNDLALGPRWLAPAVELALLAPLSVATVWTQRRARRAESAKQWQDVGRTRLRVRWAVVVLTALATVMNFGALARLVIAMVGGHAGDGRALLLDAVNIWVTNVVIFALWYWTMDRRGPGAQRSSCDLRSDFLFTQQQLAAERPEFASWSPGFIDYLFLAFTNATAFSPADTFPLSARAKLLMMSESATSLVTLALVASRAVGILG